MLSRLVIRNFKRFSDVSIELGQTVVFIGPNNSGKTSALQALPLWEHAVRKWHEQRGTRPPTKKKVGVALNRKDLMTLPIPVTELLWRDLKVREVDRSSGKAKVSNVCIEIGVEGVTNGSTWHCTMELERSNSEVVYARPVMETDATPAVPEDALATRVAFLPPMSGLVANETRLEPGAIRVRVGEGRTAEVLRNICAAVHDVPERWEKLAAHTQRLFGVELLPPVHNRDRGELSMAYREGKIELDLSAAGRGLQQTLLLLSYMLSNPGTVVLLDEPDAHLEILRQREIYQLLTDVARDTGSQLIAASHSEVLLNEAADRDVVVAFVGTPHRIDDRGSQVAKALKDIGFEHYLQAELKGWVLYLEGSTDLAILRAFAATLGHAAATELERPYVHYVGNTETAARHHFFGLRAARPDLRGLIILDTDPREPAEARPEGRPMGHCGLTGGQSGRLRTTSASQRPCWRTRARLESSVRMDLCSLAPNTAASGAP